MTARLSPAQRRVVDAMRDGAVLRLMAGSRPGRGWWDIAGFRPDVRSTNELYFRGAIKLDPRDQPVTRRCRTTLVWYQDAPRNARYVLAPAYRGGEA